MTYGCHIRASISPQCKTKRSIPASVLNQAFSNHEEENTGQKCYCQINRIAGPASLGLLVAAPANFTLEGPQHTTWREPVKAALQSGYTSKSRLGSYKKLGKGMVWTVAVKGTRLKRDLIVKAHLAYCIKYKYLEVPTAVQFINLDHRAHDWRTFVYKISPKAWPRTQSR